MQSLMPPETDSSATKRWAGASDDFSSAAVHADLTAIFRTLPLQPVRPMFTPMLRPQRHRPRAGPLLAAAIVIAAVIGFMAGILIR